MVGTGAIDKLVQGFRRRWQDLGQDAAEERVVVVSWPAVPVEIVRAAGLDAVTVIGNPGQTPAADALIEPGLFPGRLRGLIEYAVTGRLDRVAALVIPRVSDPDYKCFLYLKEFLRRGTIASLPPILLLDVLQSQGTGAAEYSAARIGDLFAKLSAISGIAASSEALEVEIGLANRARASARRLLEFRAGKPRVAGREALPMLGAFWQLPAKEYAELATRAASIIGAREVLTGPRVLLAGTPVDCSLLHEFVERAGAVVVGELSPFGSCVAGIDVDAGANPFSALALKYCRDTIGPRTPVQTLMTQLEDMLADVDAVVVALPPDDAVFGWDYPALRRLLERRRIPHAILSGDAAASLSSKDRDAIQGLVAGADAATVAERG